MYYSVVITREILYDLLLIVFMPFNNKTVYSTCQDSVISNLISPTCFQYTLVYVRYIITSNLDECNSLPCVSFIAVSL